MKVSVLLTVLALAGCGAGVVRAPVVPNAAETTMLLERAALGEAVGESLRRLGPEGMSKVAAAYDAETDPARKAHLSDTMDVVAKQKDAKYTRLFWYTDLEEAKAAAKASGKPILSLRMLGRLDEEYSCANSRFFRTALYPNHDVQALMKDFVLHWSSERPAPVMTIDFGDGRIVKRTVTGNSLHYVLDSDGAVIDAIPGLLGPQAFVAVATKARDQARVLAKVDPAIAGMVQSTWHQQQTTDLRMAWMTDLLNVKMAYQPMPADMASRTVVRNNRNAALAIPTAPSKAVVEMPMVRQVVVPGALAKDSTPWATIATARSGQCSIDANAQEAMRSKHTGALGQSADFEAMEKAFERSMAEDTAKNEYLYHAVIHQWLANGTMSFDALNGLVYEELFATPKSDPWLGLVPPNAYSGLADDGIMKR